MVNHVSELLHPETSKRRKAVSLQVYDGETDAARVPPFAQTRNSEITSRFTIEQKVQRLKRGRKVGRAVRIGRKTNRNLVVADLQGPGIFFERVWRYASQGQCVTYESTSSTRAKDVGESRSHPSLEPACLTLPVRTAQGPTVRLGLSQFLEFGGGLVSDQTRRAGLANASFGLEARRLFTKSGTQSK